MANFGRSNKSQARQSARRNVYYAEQLLCVVPKKRYFCVIVGPIAQLDRATDF